MYFLWNFLSSMILTTISRSHDIFKNCQWDSHDIFKKTLMRSFNLVALKIWVHDKEFISLHLYSGCRIRMLILKLHDSSGLFACCSSSQLRKNWHWCHDLLFSSYPRSKFDIYHIYTPRFNEVERGVNWFLLVRLSVCGQNRVRSVSSTILIGSISYLHILSSSFRRCVACGVSLKILANSLNS